eukprot:TRINITY_DN12747_c0_g1_i1.p1 TRINITY_DN12747_c0_g1~~TRINITY_DN12747_c0_g1_i1.p1  ORF type:complete len:686 (+),score=109.19 TRINITY_DN12747_c0_g1_i1:72-2129(+)
MPTMSATYERIDENTVRCDAIKKRMEAVKESTEYIQLKKTSVQIRVKERTGKELDEEEEAAKIELELKNEELGELQKELDELKAERGMLFELVKSGKSSEAPVPTDASSISTEVSPSPIPVEVGTVHPSEPETNQELEILKRKQEVLRMQLELQRAHSNNGKPVTKSQHSPPTQVRQSAVPINVEPLSVEEPVTQNTADRDYYWTWKLLPFPTILGLLLLVAYIAWFSAAVDVDYRIRNGIWLALTMQLVLLLTYLQSRMEITAVIIILAGSTAGYLLMPSCVSAGDDSDSYHPWGPDVFIASNAEDELTVFWDDGTTDQYVAAVTFLFCLVIDLIILLFHGFDSIIRCRCDFEQSKPQNVEVKKQSWIAHVVIIMLLMVSGWLVSLGGVASFHSKLDENLQGDQVFKAIRWFWYSVIGQFFALFYVTVFCCKGMYSDVETWRVPTLGMLVFSTSLAMSLTDGLINLRDADGFKSQVRVTLAGNIITQIINLVAITSIGNRLFRRKNFTGTSLDPFIGNAAAITICQITAWVVYLVGVLWINANIDGDNTTIMRGDWWGVSFQALFIIVQGMSVAAANERQWGVVVMSYSGITSMYLLFRTSRYLEYSRMSGTNLSNPGGIASSGALLSIILNFVVFFIHGTAVLRKFMFLSPKARRVQTTWNRQAEVPHTQLQEASQPFLSAAE